MRGSEFLDKQNNIVLPHFGKGDELSENVNVPAHDHIQNPVPLFRVHDNQPVINGRLLPRNEYVRVRSVEQPQPF